MDIQAAKKRGEAATEGECFQKAIEDLTREEAQAELRRAWDMWREMDDLHDQSCDWAIAANSLRAAALEALEKAQEGERMAWARVEAVEWAGRDNGVPCCLACGAHQTVGHDFPCFVATRAEGGESE